MEVFDSKKKCARFILISRLEIESIACRCRVGKKTLLHRLRVLQALQLLSSFPRSETGARYRIGYIDAANDMPNVGRLSYS